MPYLRESNAHRFCQNVVFKIGVCIRFECKAQIEMVNSLLMILNLIKLRTLENNFAKLPVHVLKQKKRTNGNLIYSVLLKIACDKITG